MLENTTEPDKKRLQRQTMDNVFTLKSAMEKTSAEK